MISQEQFCQIIGRLRLYQVLPASQMKELPKVILGDSNINAATKGYIDKFLERNQNATDFAMGIQKALRGEDTENYGWFLG